MHGGVDGLHLRVDGLHNRVELCEGMHGVWVQGNGSGDRDRDGLGWLRQSRWWEKVGGVEAHAELMVNRDIADIGNGYCCLKATRLISQLS